MKSLNSFINFRSSRPNLQSSNISLDRLLTVGSPSGLDAKMKQKSKMLRYAVVVLFVLTLGAGNVLGTTPTLDDLEFSTSNSVRIVNEDFNSLNTVTKTATVAITKTDQTEYGVFNCIYNNNTSNSYKIVNNENGFSDKSMSLSAGSGSPLIMHITDKTWGAKGAFRIKTTKTSTEYIGFYGETSGTIYAKAKSTVYLSVASGSVGIHNGGTGKSDGFVNVGSYSTDIIDICVIYNTTNSATTYGDNISLAANKAHVYINGTCVMDGASPKAFAIAQTTLTSFRVAPQASSGNKAYVDDVQIWNALPTAAETCTPLGSVNGSFNSGSQTVTWSSITDASGYKIKVENSSHVTITDWTDIGNTTSYSTSSLTCGGLTYYVYIKPYNTSNPGHCTGDGTSSDAVTVTTAACTTPAVVATPTSVSGLSYIVGMGPSAAQSFSISGSNLTSGDLTITAPSNFEVSLDNSSWGSSKTKAASGTLSATTVYVRLASGKAVNDYAGNVSISGCGLASAVTVALSGSVLKPTIVASPTSITGWNTETGSAPTPSTKTVSVTGVYLKEDISVSLTSGGSYFTIDKSSFTQTSGSASGTISISVLAAAYASAATREGNIRLTSADATTVDVPITLVVADDPRERFELLTTSNVGELGDGAKIVLVNYARDRAMNQTQDGTNGHGYVQNTGVSTDQYEFLSSNTIIALDATNNVEVLTLEEQSSGVYALKTLGDKYLQWNGGSANKFSEISSLSDPVANTEKWTIAVNSTDGNVEIRASNNGYYIGCNWGQNSGTYPATSQFRAYSSASSYKMYAYFQPSTTPTVSLTSVSKMEYDYGSGPSDPQTATLSGKNLTANLTVTAPTNFEVRKGTTGEYSGNITVTSSEALAGQTIQIRLKGNLGVNTYAGNLSVSGTDIDAAKTFALSGEVNCLSYAAGPVLGAVTAVNDHATITWSAVAGASEYEVKLGTGEWTDANGSLSHEFTSLTCGGTSYTYYVRAKAATGYCDASAATSSSFTTGDCLCSNFSFHWGNSSSNTTTNWSSMNFRCFTQVGSSHEWQIENFVIGNTTDMNKFAVGWQNTAQDNLAYGSRTAVVTLESELFFAGTQNCGNGSRPTVRYDTKTAEGAIGTLRMYDNHDNHHDWNNCYVGFIPNGYGLMYGGSTATGNSLAMHATGNTNEWETEIAVLTQDMLLTNNTYKYQVGILTNSGTYVDCGNSNPDNFGSMGSFYSSNWRSNVNTYSAGQAGKFQIWTGDCDGNVNWRCHFVPYYTINYYDLDDELIGTDYVVYGTASTTLRTVSGLGWKNASSGGRSAIGDVTNAFDSSLTLSTSQPQGVYNFYLVAAGYTVTYSVPACASVSPASQTSNSVILPTPTGTPDGYTFIGWTTAAIAGTQSSEPTIYAAGDTYYPTEATTLYACYRNSSGAGSNVTFNVMKNSASIVAGYYVITANRSGEANALYNTIYNSTKLNSVVVDGSGASSTMSPSEKGAVWEFIADGDNWKIRNYANGKYLAALDNNYSNQIGLVDAVTNNYGKWKIQLKNGDNNADTHIIYNVGKGSEGTGSDVKHWFLRQYTASGTDVWAANSIKDSQVATNGAVLYFFNLTTTPDFGSTYSYTTNPTCKFVVSVSSPDNVTITATPSGGSAVAEGGNSGATVTAGTTVTLSGTPDACYQTVLWTVTRDDGGANVLTNSASTSFTMPESDVTVTASVSAKPNYTITYTIPSGGGSAVSPTTSVCAGGTVTLPNVTGISSEYSCETFLGWTTTAPDGSGTWASTPSYKAAGATSDAINSNTTFYAVYSRSGGGASGTVELTNDDIKDHFQSNSTDVNAYGVRQTYDKSGDVWATNGYTGNTNPYCIQLANDNNKSVVYPYLEIPAQAGTISTITINYRAVSSDSRTIYFNNSGTSTTGALTHTFDGTYISGDHDLVWDVSSKGWYSGYIMASTSFKINSISVSYGPPAVISHTLECGCDINEFNLTYDANTTNFAGSTTSCSDVVGWNFDDDGDYTICSTEPTLAGYKFTGWTTNANGSGDHFDAGEEVSCMPSANVTLYAQYERVYTVHFNDQSTVTDRTQASAGAAVTVPGHTTPCVMAGATWEFAGWSKTGSALADAISATIDIAADATEYTPESTDDGETFYAVYKKTADAGSAFSVGKTGYYRFYYTYNGKDYYACNNQSNGIYAAYSDQTDYFYPQTFRFEYHPTGTYAGKYTIQRADGNYIGYSGSSTGLQFNASAASNLYYWTISTSGGGFVIQNVNTNTRYISGDGGANFNAKSTCSDVLKFVPAPAVSYFTYMTCGSTFSITFTDGGGTINWTTGYPQGTYEDVPDGTMFSTFPTAMMDGWTFVGWTVGQGYSNMSKYSAGRDAISGSGIIFPDDADVYKTGGNSYTIHSNVTMYPLFTRFEDNEPIDLTNGGDYYIYFLESGSNDGYGGEKRVYAATYDGEKRYNSTAVCDNATEFTFTKLANGKWTIKDKTADKYLYATNEGEDKLMQSTTAYEWTITIRSGNQFDASCDGQIYGQLIANGNGTSSTFMSYSKGNIVSNAALYHPVYLGSCTNRIFSSNPSTTPDIDLKGTAVVTASQNGAVRGTNVLTVSGHNLTPSTGEITITSNNSDVYFSKTTAESFAAGIAAASNPKTSITVAANSSGIVTPTSIYVHYKPSSNTDAVADVTVTATYSGADDATTTIKVRSVKENFVIAAKVGTSWYALPANMGTSNVYEPTLIEVDEEDNEAFGPSTVAYKMWPVKTTNGSGNRYEAAGNLVRFAGNSNNALWANNASSSPTTGIRNWAVVNSLTSGGSGEGEDKDERYEWQLTTIDGVTYTIKTNQTNNKRDLALYRPSNGANAGKLVWATNNSYETNSLRLIPLTELAEIKIFPREWKTNGLVYSVAADNRISAVSYKIGDGSETVTTYTRHSTGGYGLYEVALPDLTSQYGKLLTLKMTIDGVATYARTTIPIIVDADKSTKDSEPFVTLSAATKDYDVVVLDGKTLTTDAISSGACKFQNLYLYAGSTLVNSANNNLSVRYLELRGGIKGIDHKSDLAQGVPHLMLGKNFNSTAGANLDMVVNTAHSYALSVPFDVSLANVNFANFLNPNTNEAVAGTLDAQFLIMEYDGEQRVTTGQTGWKHITSTDRTLHAGEGYVLQAKRPKGQPFGVIRFPFSSVSGWADGSGEVTKSAISISAHAGGANTPDNDKGWNLIANPYMANVSYTSGDESTFVANFKVGQLVKTNTDPWDGKYQYTDKTNAYVTIPNDWYSEFPQYRANTVTFEPFKNFFIQASANGSVTFDRSYRAAMPRYLMAENETAVPVYADINLTHDSKTAQAGITIDANAAEGYKFGEDQNIFESREALTYLKMYTIADGHYLVGNTLTPTEAEQLIPLEFYAPDKNSEYVFSLSETSDMEQFEYVMLYDAALGLSTDLLSDDYSVELDESGLVENRFSISLKVKEEEEIATGVDNINGAKKQPLKFIYHDKMYILQNGVIYDATGKKVREINK